MTGDGRVAAGGTAIDRRTLLQGAAAAAAVGAIGATLATRSSAVAQLTGGDSDLYQFGIIAESMLEAAYRKALDGPLLSDQDKRLLTPVVAHQEAYAEAFRNLVRQTGGTPIEDPVFEFPDANTREECLALISELEELDARTWVGLIGDVPRPELITATRGMLMGKVRHAAVVGFLQGDQGKPTPEAIMTPNNLQSFLDTISKYRKD
jgi:hypothetical protein